MRIRRHWPVVMVLLLMPRAALAHDHTADFFGASSFGFASSLWGFHTTLAITSGVPSNRDLSLLGDFSVHVGEHDALDLTRVTFMGGARYSIDADRLGGHIIHFQALLGGVHDAGTATATDWAFAAGAAWEYLLQRSKDPAGFGFRVQADYVKNLTGGEDFPRYSAGITYRIPRRVP